MKIVPQVLVRDGPSSHEEWNGSPLLIFRVAAQPKNVLVIATQPPANGLSLTMDGDGTVLAGGAPLRDLLAHSDKYQVRDGRVVWLQPPTPTVHANGDRYDFRSINLVPGEGPPFDDHASHHWLQLKSEITGGEYTPGFYPGSQYRAVREDAEGKSVGYYSERGTFCSSRVEAEHMTKAGK